MFLGNTRRHKIPRELAIIVVFYIIFAFKNNLVPILHEDPIDSEIIYINLDFEWLGEI